MATRYEQAHPLHRFVRRTAATAPVAWFQARTLHHLDRLTHRLSGGRTTVAALVSGLPVVMLTTTGSRSGRARTSPLLGLPDGDRLVVVASNFGRAHHPAWYHNLRAHPRAVVSVDGARREVIASEAIGADRERLWAEGVRVYPAWTAYERRAAPRQIPIVVLTPVDTAG